MGKKTQFMQNDQNFILIFHMQIGNCMAWQPGKQICAYSNACTYNRGCSYRGLKAET